MHYLPSTIVVYIRSGYTDMRKGAYSLSIVSESLVGGTEADSVVVVFRGKSSRLIRLLWWSGQGYCVLSKYLESGKFHWISDESKGFIRATHAQLALLMQGVEWQIPHRVRAPEMAS